MDAILERVSAFSHQLRYDDLSSAAVHECKRHIIDTVGCALGGFSAEPSRIARAIAMRSPCENGARIFGTLDRSTVELAAFANGVMIRYLDFNDATGSGGGHPSDALSALLAVAESTHADGKTFLTATALAYEIFLGFFAAVRIGDTGWDHVVYTVLAAAAGVSKIMNLGPKATANALSLALTPNMALGVVRRGDLSMWKGGAGANASRNAVFAAQLAAEGMSAPDSVFEGENGVQKAVGKFEWPPFAGADRPFRILGTPIKLYPCEYHGQSPIEAMLAVRSGIDPDDIEKIVVRTYWFAWKVIGSGAEKWAPANRETADHSIPFLICAALLDGKVDGDTFSASRISDARVRTLMHKVQVIHDEALDKLQPHSNPCRMEITLRNGKKISSNTDYPKGHIKNPASDADIEKKLVSLNNGMLTNAQVAKVLDLCWRLEELEDLSELVSALRI